MALRTLTGRVALVTGASRGIGRAVALALARQGASVVVAAKSERSTDRLPGSIHSVAEEVEKAHADARALAVKTDLRSEDDMRNCVQQAMQKFGRIDILVNNASALWWQPIDATPLKKYDLINTINSRASFFMTSLCAPIMADGGWGRVVCMSPPIVLSPPAFVGRTAYNISKYGMTMTALGVAQEYGKKQNVLGNSLWPATIIESQASINFDLGERNDWRKADILADCVVELCYDDDTNGAMLIDDTYLLSRGYTKNDLVKYRYVPDHEPRRLLDYTSSDAGKDVMVRRGDVKKVDEDKQAAARAAAERGVPTAKL
mmetsp:Transcript_17142/g.42117  ORF Transcript_17142/g.42117 Transcript_17142/m.42117 type:complete len:317 (-) Transcript_17142:27-977(-)